MGRTFLAGIVVVFGTGFLFASDGTLAKGAAVLSGKSSGLVLRHGLPFRGGVARRSVFLPPIVPPLNIFNSGVAPRRYSYPVSGYRRTYGRDLPAAGVGVYYGSYDVGDGPLFVPSLPASQSVVRSGGRRTDGDWRDCSSQKLIVPSEEGGERHVTVHRC